MSHNKPTKSITLTKSKSSGASSKSDGQPLTAQQRSSKFAPLPASAPSRRERQREIEYEVEEREEEEERRSRSSSKARSEEEEEYEQEESPVRRSPSPAPKNRRPRTPPRASSSNGGSKQSRPKERDVKEPQKGLGREFSSLLLQNIPLHLEATDLFLNVFDASDDAAEIEMHTHEDGTSTGTAQMYFEREGAAEAALRKHNGHMVEGKPLRMLVIKAKKQAARPAVTPSPPKRKRDVSPSPPPRKLQAPSKPDAKEPRKLSRVEVPIIKPSTQGRPLIKPDLRKSKEAPLVKPKAPPRPVWNVTDTDSFGFAPEQDEPERPPHRVPEVVRPRLTKPKSGPSVQVVHREGQPHQVYLAKNNKYNR